MLDIIMKDYADGKKICGFRWQQVPRQFELIKVDDIYYFILRIEWNQFGSPSLYVEKR